MHVVDVNTKFDSIRGEHVGEGRVKIRVADD